jgi:hypothetical protein
MYEANMIQTTATGMIPISASMISSLVRPQFLQRIAGSSNIVPEIEHFPFMIFVPISFLPPALLVNDYDGSVTP